MFKRVATTILVAALVGGTAFADAKLGGVARQLSMGGGGSSGLAVNPFIWQDPTLMYLNPAWGNTYKDYLWINAGGGPLTGTTSSNDGYGLQHGGMNFSLGNNLTIGSIYSHDPTAANLIAGAIAPGGTGLNTGLPVSPVEVLSAMASLGLANNVSVGLRVLYGWTSADATNPAGDPSAGLNEFTASVFGAQAGIYVGLSGGSAIEGAISFASSSADDKAGQLSPPINATASATEIGVAARAKLRINNKVNFIPVVGFVTASGDGNDGQATATTVDLKQTAFGLGAGFDLTVGDFYFAGGASFASSTSEQTVNPPSGGSSTDKWTGTMLPVLQFGAEYDFNDWLTGRAGFVRALTNWKNEATAGGMTYETNQFAGYSWVSVPGYVQDNLVVFGVAGAFGDFAFEATVSESALRRGLGLIGASDNINTFGYITTSFSFDN